VGEGLHPTLRDGAAKDGAPGIPQGLKPRLSAGVEAKPEGLAYLKAWLTWAGVGAPGSGLPIPVDAGLLLTRVTLRITKELDD
jgi:hypothetical protein